MRKIAILSLCLVLLLAVCAYSASANIMLTSAFNSNSPTFGGPNQAASNPNADNEEDEVIYATGSLSLSNNGTADVTISSIAVTPKLTSTSQTFSVADLNITLPAAVTVPAGGSAAVQLRAKIPNNLDSVDKQLREAAFNVADITLKNSAGTAVLTFSAYMQRENHLVFDKVYVNIGDRSDSVDDEDSVDEIKPGDSVEVEATVENTYDDSNDDIDIENIELLVLIDDKDLDVDEDADMSDLGAEESDTETVSFDVEDDVGDDDYLMEITVEGEDEHGARHGQRMNVDFTVEKNKHEIRLTKITPPATADCGETVQVKVEIANIGKSDEDEVTLRVSSIDEDLGIDQIISGIALDEGDSTIKTIEMKLPKTSPEGPQSFTVISHYDYNEESDREVFSINVNCEKEDVAEEEEEEEDSTPASSTTGSQDTTPPASSSSSGTATAQPVDSSSSATGAVTTVRDSGDGLRDSTLYVLLLILAIIIVAAVGTILIVKVLVVR